MDHHEPVTRPATDLCRRALTTPSGRLVSGVSPRAYAIEMDMAADLPTVPRHADHAAALMNAFRLDARHITQATDPANR